MLCRELSYALAALAIAPAARAEPTPESTFEHIRRTRVVRIGVVGGQAPYCVHDLGSGEWRGFIQAYGRDLAKAMDSQTEFVETNWGNAVLDLQAKQAGRVLRSQCDAATGSGDRLHSSAVQQPVHADCPSGLPSRNVGGTE